MQIEALLDRKDFANAARLKDSEFQQYANAGLIPACLGFYGGQPLWNTTAVTDFCIKHKLPPSGGIPDTEPVASMPSTSIESAETPPQAASTAPRRATMSVADVCVRLGTSPATLAKRRAAGISPEFEQNGRVVLYFADSVDAIYTEHGKLPRHYTPDGIASMVANAAKARAKQAEKKPVVQLMKPPAPALLEPKQDIPVGRKVVVSGSAGLDEETAAEHLGIELLMLRILRKAALGPAVATTEPVSYRMKALNDYTTVNGLQYGQISRPDKNFLDQRVRIPEAASITRMTPKALEHHRAKGTGPLWERQGIFSVYKRGDLYSWLVGKDLLAEEAMRTAK
jgi:hypothetical protein